jgi:phosphomevalonate kinase
MVNKFEGFRKGDSLSSANTFYDLVKDQQKVDIKKKSRRTSVVKYRRFFYKFMHEVCKEPLTTMGSYLGQDHATALHAINKLDSIFLRRPDEKREYELLKATVLGTTIPMYVPDKKDKYIQVLTERLQSNHKMLCNYQKQISDLEKLLLKSKYKIVQAENKNSELKKEINIMRSEAKSIYQEYKKQRGITI